MSNEQKIAPEVLVLELCNSAKSQFMMDGPGGIDMPDDTTAIQFPSKRNILTTSKIKVWDDVNKTWGIKTIRYIAGCPFIDPAEQERNGYFPNYMQDIIQFVHGHLTVVKTGADIGKFLFLKASSGNASLPADQRPDNAIDVYKEINTEIETGKTELIIDAELRARNYVAQLKTTDKLGVSVYNENDIAFLCSLFKLPAYESGFRSEAYVALQQLAQSDPLMFLRKIGDVKGRYQSDVAAGIAKGLLTFDGVRAFFTDGMKWITTFDGAESHDDQVAQLTEHMSNPNNEKDYKHLRSLLDESVNKSAGIVT